MLVGSKDGTRTSSLEETMMVGILGIWTGAIGGRVDSREDSSGDIEEDSLGMQSNTTINLVVIGGNLVQATTEAVGEILLIKKVREDGVGEQEQGDMVVQLQGDILLVRDT